MDKKIKAVYDMRAKIIRAMAHLVKAMQEQQAQIFALQTVVDSLRALHAK